MEAKHSKKGRYGNRKTIFDNHAGCPVDLINDNSYVQKELEGMYNLLTMNGAADQRVYSVKVLMDLAFKAGKRALEQRQEQEMKDLVFEQFLAKHPDKQLFVL